MLVGTKVSLRALEEPDLVQLRDWRNNESFRKFFREYRELNLNDQQNWFDKFVVKNENTIMFGILDENKDLIGVCGLCYINWINRFADLSLYIGKDNIYVDVNKDGYAWSTLDMLFDFAFNRLALHKVWTEIYEFDKNKNELYHEYGFNKDAILRDNYFYDGKYMNSHIYSILEDEWRKSK